MSDHVRAFGVERVYEPDDVIGHERRAVSGDARGLVAPAKATEVRRDDAKSPREGGDLLAPGARGLGEAMKQEDERALSLHHAMEMNGVDPDFALDRAMLARPMPEGWA
jgi:hypothetical protein